MSSKTKTEKETVTLAKPHKHRRRLRAEGDKITVRPDQAERLRRAGKVATNSKPEVSHEA